LDTSKYNRSIPLNCPTCGGTEFASSNDEDQLVRCTRCDLELTKDELISRNQENIKVHTDEVKREVVDDIKKQLSKSLRDAFRGSKNIKLK
jgi:hypothetical protein